MRVSCLLNTGLDYSVSIYLYFQHLIVIMSLKTRMRSVCEYSEVFQWFITVMPLETHWGLVGGSSSRKLLNFRGSLIVVPWLLSGSEKSGIEE